MSTASCTGELWRHALEVSKWNCESDTTQCQRHFITYHTHARACSDVKPANILIDSEGHVSLSDLGLAVFFTPAQR